MPKEVKTFRTAEKIVSEFGYSWEEVKFMFRKLKSTNGYFVTDFAAKQFNAKDIFQFYIEVSNYIQEDRVSSTELMTLLQDEES